MKKITIFINSLLLCIAAVSSYASTALSGTKAIVLIDGDNKELPIGEIAFAGSGDNITYKIDLNGKEFRDEFLSMRPFKCMRFDVKMVCHLAYTYTKKGYINSGDLVDLEYDLLFLHKAAGEYGINAWNGLYYDLTITEGRLDGTLKEVDLNVLSAPPEKGILRPVTEDMLHDADPERHLFPRLMIK